MAKKSSTKKPNIALCAGFILLCLTLFSMHFTSGLYARYISRDSAEDSARVIKFGELTLKETGDFVKDGAPVKAIIIPGSDLTKKVTVSFTGSESATYVFVKVDLSNQWSKFTDSHFGIGTGLIEWKVDSRWKLVEGTNYVYVVELEPNELLSDQPFIKDGLIKVSSNLTESFMTTDLTGLHIKLQAFVVQGNGFENAKKAWDSVSSK